jgi:hypothetical protein
MTQLKTKQVNLIELNDWDDLVMKTYGRIYSFQQQDNCKERGSFFFTVPNTYPEDFENDSIPEIINGFKIGVSFATWLARDPKQMMPEPEDQNCLKLFWKRSFYPHVSMIINDLQKKGILDVGEYFIEIDW